MEQNKLPDVLKGLKVWERTRVIAGPYCGMMLADMGAEVVKLEVPGVGDDARAYPPFQNGESMMFQLFNRNKNSITLNLKTERGKEIFKELLPHFDILLENFRPGVMDKMGLGYTDLEKIHPGLIYGAVSGFGQTGPYSQKPGYDIVGQAVGGLMSTTGWPGGEPTRTGPAMADLLSGLNLTVGVLSAYIRRQQTGHGDKVDIALVDSVVAGLDFLPQWYFTTGKVPERNGNMYNAAYPYDTFKAQDETFVIACGNDKLFHILLEVMGRTDAAGDPRFQTNDLRLQNHVILKQMIEEWAADKKADEVVKALNDSGCPACVVFDIARITKDPHIAGDRKMFVDIEGPKTGMMHLTGTVFKFANGHADIYKRAPELGEETEEYLTSMLHYTPEEVAALRKDKII